MWTTIYTKVHQRAIDEALSDFSESDRSILHHGQVIADEDQSVEGSYKHSMRAPYQTVGEAANIANEFVRKQFKKAKKLKEKCREKSLTEFSIGLHALQDATSPSHEGFQEWDPDSSLLSQAHHVRKEIFYPNRGRARALEGVTKRAWVLYKSNSPIPKKFFSKKGKLIF